MQERYVILFYTILTVFTAWGGYYFGSHFTTPRTTIVEKEGDCVAEVRYLAATSTPVAATSTVPACAIDACEMESFAYQVITDHYDLGGRQDLTRGDVYTMDSRVYNYGLDRFCSDDNCVDEQVVLNRSLFKPIY